MCVLRNLSYQIYSEMPPKFAQRLEGPTRDQASGKGTAIGCFAPRSRKAKNVCTHWNHDHQQVLNMGQGRPSQHCLLLSFFSSQKKNQDIGTFTEISRMPKGIEWLWHTQIVGLYKRVLQECEINSTTRDAAAGALQNITAGDNRVNSTCARPRIGGVTNSSCT